MSTIKTLNARRNMLLHSALRRDLAARRLCAANFTAAAPRARVLWAAAERFQASERRVVRVLHGLATYDRDAHMWVAR
jgi:hypothetical protein